MTIIPPGFGQVVQPISLVGDDRDFVITFGVDLSDAGGDYQGAVDGIQLNVNASTGLLGRMNSQYALEPPVLYVGSDGGPSAVFVASGAAAAGTGAAAPLPQNCAVVVQKRTAAAGRRNRGRFYFPGPYEGDVDPTGHIGATQVGIYQTAFDAMLSNLETGGGPGAYATPMVVLHAPGASPTPAPTPVTALRVEALIGTQRQRMRR